MTLPTLLLYVLWLALTAWTMTLHWIYPFIVFSLGAVILHNSVLGAPLRALVKWVQAQRKVDPRRAQQLTFAAGFLAVLACTPVVALTSRQAEERRFEAQRLEAEADQQREAAARAERETARAAAQAEAERIKAAQEAAAAKAAEQRRVQREADARRRDSEEAERQRQEDAQRAEQKRKDDAARAEQVRQDKDRQEQEAARKEAVRRAEEGPYTWHQAQEMCLDEVGRLVGWPGKAIRPLGSYTEVMDGLPRNARFGDGHVWVWRPTLKVPEVDTGMRVLCHVFDNGLVQLLDP